jgi:hypothetical protein
MGDEGVDDDSVARDPIDPVQSRSVFTWGSIGMRVFTVAMLLVIGGFGIHDVVVNPRADLLTNAVLYGLICTFFLASATTRIQSSESRLLIVNPASITEVPSALIVTVDGENGLAITTRTGEEVGFWGYGSSLLGKYVAYRGPRRTAAKIRAWHDQQSFAGHHHHAADQIRRRLRVAVPITAVVAITSFVCLGLMLH